MYSDEQIKNNLQHYVAGNLIKSPHAKNMYICPICGSGTGANKSGAFSIMPDGQRWKCFACNSKGDLIDLIECIENKTTAEAWKRARELYGSEPAQPMQAQPSQNTQASAGYSKEDFIRFANALQAEPNAGADYLRGRGFNIKGLKSYGIGFDGKNIVIPYLNGSGYFLRGIHADYKGKRGRQELYNGVALLSSNPVFIVEGQLDALAVMQAGGQAVALGSTANAKLLIDQVKENAPQCSFLLALDNDEAGQAATEEIENALQALNFSVKRAQISGSYKDPAERLQSDCKGLQTAIMAEMSKKEGEAMQAKRQSAAQRLDRFKAEIKSGINNAISTGFQNIDTETGGGFYNGLIVIGAESSLGKSTLVMQIADQMATGGKDILIFSLEMSEREIMARSLSRLAYTETGTKITAREILQGEPIPAEAENKYIEYAKNVYIVQATKPISAAEIAKEAREHTTITGRAPVVVVDYLQLIAPVNQYESDKGKLDNAVTILKMLSQELATPVITISSLNRNSYNEPVKMSALKESGGIEYTADIIAGLQLAATERGTLDTAEANAERKKEPRAMSLTILKNRNGSTGGTVYFDYYPAQNYFKETAKQEQKKKGNYL